MVIFNWLREILRARKQSSKNNCDSYDFLTVDIKSWNTMHRIFKAGFHLVVYSSLTTVLFAQRWNLTLIQSQILPAKEVPRNNALSFHSRSTLYVIISSTKHFSCIHKLSYDYNVVLIQFMSPNGCSKNGLRPAIQQPAGIIWRKYRILRLTPDNNRKSYRKCNHLYVTEITWAISKNFRLGLRDVNKRSHHWDQAVSR